MIKFNGILIATSDLQLIQNASIDVNTKIIFIGDPEGQYNFINSYKMILAGSWFPDCNTLESDLNGNIEEFSARYMDYLANENSQILFATIFTALMRGKNIILYFPAETMEFKYPSYLLNYIINIFGITCETPTTKFNFYQNFSDRILELMYTFNTISSIEFIMLSDSMDIASLSKLVRDFGIPISGDFFKNPKPLLDFLENYKQNMIKSNMLLDKPFMIEVKC